VGEWFATVKREKQNWKKRFANSAASNIKKDTSLLRNCYNVQEKSAQQQRSSSAPSENLSANPTGLEQYLIRYFPFIILQ